MATPVTPPLPYNYSTSSVQRAEREFNFVATGTAPKTYSQTIGSLTTANGVALTNPPLPGLYTILIGTGASDVYSVQSCLSLTAAFNGATWTLGGNNSVIINGSTTAFSQVFKSLDSTTLTFYNGSGQTITSMGAVMVFTAHLNF